MHIAYVDLNGCQNKELMCIQYKNEIQLNVLISKDVEIKSIYTYSIGMTDAMEGVKQKITISFISLPA